jgi:hypothetical protein
MDRFQLSVNLNTRQSEGGTALLVEDGAGAGAGDAGSAVGGANAEAVGAGGVAVDVAVDVAGVICIAGGCGFVGGDEGVAAGWGAAGRTAVASWQG